MQHHQPSSEPGKPQLSGGAVLALPLLPDQQVLNVDLHLERIKKMLNRLEPMRRLHSTGPPRPPRCIVT